MGLLPRNWQNPLHHLLQNKTPLPECPETGVPKEVKELLGLVVPPGGVPSEECPMHAVSGGKEAFPPTSDGGGSQALSG